MASLLVHTVASDFPLTEGSEVNAQWIKAIRTSWKKIAADLKDYEGRIDHHPEPTAEVVADALNASRKALRLLSNYVDRMSEDLLFNKGMWELPSEAGKNEPDEKRRWKTRVITQLAKAKKVVEKYTALNEDKRKKIEKGSVTKSEFPKLIGRAYTYVEKAVTQVHKTIMNIMSKLHKVHQHYASKGKTFDQGSFAPRVNHIGHTTVIFDDVPAGLGPHEVGSETYKKTSKGKLKLVRSVAAARLDHKKRKRMLYRHPKHREAYLPLVKKALARLNAKGLGWLAYDKIRVRPEGMTKHTNTQAAYRRDNDTVYVYCDPKKSLPGSIIHEYGHRYWYKFMTEQDRKNFSKWFGKVKAVSTYGATATWEDFAEVFLHYVEDRKLTKDQRERFTQFMKGKVPKVEWLEEGTATKAQKCKYCDEPAAVSLIWADGRAYIPCCKAHERKARNKIASQNDSVCDVKQVEQGPYAPPSQRGQQMGPQARAESYYPPGHPAGLMQSALEDPLAFVEAEEPGAHFGLQADPQRVQSAFQEAPEDTTPRARIGRRSTPRGAVHTQHSGPDIQGVTGKPIKRSTTGRHGRGTRGYTRKVVKPDREVQEIPDSLLQMLGTDWKTMRAHRVHDNRMTVNIDGVRFSVYTRRG